ncbi:MAG: peptidylprolyl isomerase [Nannocystaceae bacterium]
MGERRRRWRPGPWAGLLLAGSALWGLHRIARPPDAEVVRVSGPTVAALAERFSQQQGRAPTDDELGELVDAWVEGEILVREARARGLDRADPIVRRRLAQAMRFALEDADLPADPGDAVLEDWLDRHPDRYRRPARRGFEQVFVASEGERGRERAESIATQLRDGADPTTHGDAFPLGRREPPASTDALSRRYGDDFAQLVAAAPVGRWVVASSSFGWHVLRIDDESPGAQLPLAAARDRVLADWRAEQRERRLEAGLDELRERYRVEIER